MEEGTWLTDSSSSSDIVPLSQTHVCSHFIYIFSFCRLDLHLIATFAMQKIFVVVLIQCLIYIHIYIYITHTYLCMYLIKKKLIFRDMDENEDHHMKYSKIWYTLKETYCIFTCSSVGHDPLGAAYQISIHCNIRKIEKHWSKCMQYVIHIVCNMH